MRWSGHQGFVGQGHQEFQQRLRDNQLCQRYYELHSRFRIDAKLRHYGDGGQSACRDGLGQRRLRICVAALVLVFAHMFNLVMGLLSVYIHNGRLQYVEFFGKFYTGEGQLFVPFGSDTKYTLVK